MPAPLTKGLGPKSFNPASRNNVPLAGPVRPPSVYTRPVCRPHLLAPGPRSPRRQRSRLVTTNFKPSNEHNEETHVVKPKSIRHPVTEDPFAGAGPAETATQEVIFHAASSTAAAAAAPQTPGFLESMAQTGRQMAFLLTHPRPLMRAAARNSHTIGFSLLAYALAVLARQPLSTFWSFYCTSLDSYPLITKIATGIVSTIAGDFVAQHISYQVEVKAALERGEGASAFVFDAVRTSRLVIYGALVGTPIGHAWFKLLDSSIMPEAMTSAPAVLTKMSLDQLFMSPLLTALFFVVMRCWEGHPDDALAYMRDKMVPTLKANYLLWPVAHIVNFAFVPPSQRILYCNAVGVVWTVILSSILNSRSSSPTAGQDPSTLASGSKGPGPAPGGGGSGGPSSSSSRGGAYPPGGSGNVGEQLMAPSTGPAEIVPGLAAQPAGVHGSRIMRDVDWRDDYVGQSAVSPSTTLVSAQPKQRSAARKEP